LVLLLNFPSRSRASRSGFYAAAKKVAAKPQSSQPPGKTQRLRRLAKV